MNGLVAPRYSANGVHCMGDAVHRHPPTNGLGLNMSVADGFNLAWKLALVERVSQEPDCSIPIPPSVNRWVPPAWVVRCRVRARRAGSDATRRMIRH